MNDCIPEVVKAMRAGIKETGSGKLFAAKNTADDPSELISRRKYVLPRFGPSGEICALVVDGCVFGGTAVTIASRNFPQQLLHFHWAGNGAMPSPHAQRAYMAFVHTRAASTSAR